MRSTIPWTRSSCRWAKSLGRIQDGAAKREAMAEVKAEGREWTARDEDEWKAALFCLGYPPDMEQQQPEKKPCQKPIRSFHGGETRVE